jgi:hypothetical protein
MVVLAVVMAINFKGSSAPKPQQVQGPPPTVDISGAASGPTTEPVEVATATPTTAPATKPVASTKPAQGKPHVDLLAKIDLTRDVVAGQWMAVTGGISSDESKFARISLPYEPPKEYDFRVEFTRVLGNDSVLQIFRDNGKDCTWVMNGWKGTACAFNLVNGKAGPDNDASTKEFDLKAGKRHVSILKVRKDFIEATLDGKVVVHFDTDGTNLSRGKDWNLGRPRTLGIGSNSCAAIFHKIEVVEVSGKGKAATAAISLPATQPGKGK